MTNIHLLAWCALILGTSASAVFAHEGEEGHAHEPIAVKPAEMYQPTAMPDRIVLTWSGDPRTTQAVTWRTSVEVATGLAEIAEAEGGPNFPKQATQHKAITEALKTDLNTAHFHSVNFENLIPGTRYAYRVGDGVNWSEWFQFSTATEQPEPFSFIYFGDAQNNIRSMWSRVIREAYRDAPKAAFLLHAGDLINHADSDAEWGEWFGAGAWLNAMTPNVAIPGNHELAEGPNGTRRLTRHWRTSFAFPENGPRGLEETCFTFVYHNLRIIGLNSNELHQEQTVWLEKVLAENKSPWVICTFHHPIYATNKYRDNADLRALWKPLFDRYKVDLVLQGHDHAYGRTGFNVPGVNVPQSEFSTFGAAVEQAKQGADGKVKVGMVNVPTGVQNVDQQNGTVYVVSVSGPKMYDNARFPFMLRNGEDIQLYQIIHVDGDKLRYEARTAIGQLYDAFELRKQGKGVNNQLVEIPGEIPAVLRGAKP
ncbi:metallophosphoesterase family protein [Blastopirellula sp. JC732]|uniref:Metallophosphoesterase family protein n=1 Tax=Blastopirellula sediminis TaxID=2894196 RepID=A0A9X1MKL1_9BACT|nr:metallophosphoesterase family protein [Blastopirellula sediminis]MCC9608932.1 metallophosphoesterase family protein [Blastopirellula sediminis]MCC9628291.1 metallophosphoesterase family protein [Blastopirellula sediminis]